MGGVDVFRVEDGSAVPLGDLLQGAGGRHVLAAVAPQGAVARAATSWRESYSARKVGTAKGPVAITISRIAPMYGPGGVLATCPRP